MKFKFHFSFLLMEKKLHTVQDFWHSTI